MNKADNDLVEDADVAGRARRTFDSPAATMGKATATADVHASDSWAEVPIR